MRHLKPLLAALLLPSMAHATEDALALVPLPLDTLQGEIAVTEVPFIIGKALPESAFQAIGLPYVPPSVSFNEQDDINLASLAGIRIEPHYLSGRAFRIKLDYGEVAEEHRGEELLAAVVECVHRVAEGGNPAYTVELSITKLPAESPLHATLERLVETRARKGDAGGEAPGEE